MANVNKPNTRLLNYPEPRSYDNLPFTAPPTPNNPVVRGYPLHILSQVVASSSFVQSILWSNAGFNKLRNRKELDDISPRYDPTVIKPGNGQAISEEAHLSTLANEDWTAKKPSSSFFPSALDYHEAYRAGTITPTDVVEALLPLIRRDVSPKSDHATAFLTTQAALVRRAAEESTARYRSGAPLSPLDGVPMAVKDETDLTGYKKSLGSKVDFTRADDATSFCAAAWQAAGAICIGKTTMHELGTDTTNCNPNFGTPRNPYARNFFCGGSSGGSAYAVSAGLVPFAMGNDGGGSIRIPATYCGVFGLKPSAGRVSTRPTANLAKSTGVAGPIAANMLDLELAYRVMARPDPADVESALFAPPISVQRSNSMNLLGICTPWLARADPAVRKLLDAAITHLTTTAGYSTIEIHLPLLAEGQLAHAMTILAELGSGISPSQLSLLSGPTKILLGTGSRTSAVDFLQAQKLRHLLMRHLAQLYTSHPGLVIVTPTTPNAGWRAQAGDLKFGVSDANMSLRSMEFAWLANFCGCPAISAPVGYVSDSTKGEGAGNVPVGIMAMAEWGAEEEVLAFGYDVEEFMVGKAEGGRLKPEVWVDVLGLAGKK